MSATTISLPNSCLPTKRGASLSFVRSQISCVGTVMPNLQTTLGRARSARSLRRQRRHLNRRSVGSSSRKTGPTQPAKHLSRWPRPSAVPLWGPNARITKLSSKPRASSALSHASRRPKQGGSCELKAHGRGRLRPPVNARATAPRPSTPALRTTMPAMMPSTYSRRWWRASCSDALSRQWGSSCWIGASTSGPPHCSTSTICSMRMGRGSTLPHP